MQEGNTGHIQQETLLCTAQSNHKHTPEMYGLGIPVNNIPVTYF